MSERLWCVHIEGLNDFIATGSRESARQEASAINAYIDSAEKGPRAAILRAVVIEWPYSADAHRRALHDNRDSGANYESHADHANRANPANRHSHDAQPPPPRDANAAAPGGALFNLARRVKEFVSAGRNK